MDNSVDVRITGDATGAVDAAKASKAEVAAAADLMKSKLAEAGEAAKKSYDLVGKSAEIAAAKVTEAGKATSDAASETEAAAESQGRTWKDAGAKAATLAAAAVGAGAALYGMAIASLETTAAIGTTASQLGITTDDLQIYTYAAGRSSIAQADMETSLQTLTRAIGNAALGAEAQARVFRALGIDVRDTNGHVKDAGQIIPELADALKEIEDPARRAAIETDLFGASGANLDGLLKGGSARINELAAEAKNLGLVLDNDLINQADEAANKASALSGVLSAQINAAVARNVESINYLTQSLVSFAEAALRAVNSYRQFQNLGGFGGKADVGALLKSGTGRRDLISTFDDNASRARARGRLRETSAPLRGGLSAADREYIAGENAFATRQERAAASVRRVESMTPAAAKSGADGSVGAYKAPAPAKGRSARSSASKDDSADTIRGWDSELASQKLAFAKMQDEQGSFQEFSKLSEADYWATILDKSGLSEKERLSATQKYLAAHSSAQKEAFGEQLAQWRVEMEEAKNNNAERLKIAEKTAVEIGKKYGLESREYKDAQRQILQIKRDTVVELAAIAAEQARAEDEARMASIDGAEDEARHELAMGRITNRELIAQELGFEAQRAQIAREALQREIVAERSGPNSPQTLARLNNQKLELERNYLARRNALQRQADLASTSRTRQGIASVSQSWGAALARLATLQAGFGETIKSMWQGLVGAVIQAFTDMIAQYIAQWLTSLLIKKVAGKAEAVGEFAKLTAMAGAGGTASMAAAPFPLNLGAPAFGAAMSAATAAYAPLAAFETGAWEIPNDGPALIHKGEMVVPRTFAEDLRSNGGLGGKKGGGASYHYHDHTERGVTPAQIMANRGAYAKAVKQAQREGHFIGSKVLV